MAIPATGPVDGTPAGAQALTRAARRAQLRDLLNSSFIAVGLLVLLVLFSVASPYFLTSANMYRILQQVAVVAVLAVGQAFVIITAGIDLSQGSVVALTGICLLLSYHAGVPFAGALVLALVVGVAVGCFNGTLVTIFHMPPFIATLASLAIAGGSALLASGGQPEFGLPSGFTAFGSDGLGTVPDIAIVAIGVAVVGQFMLGLTRFGRYTYAIGSNALAARVAGVRVRGQVFSVYVMSALCSAIGGVLLTAYVNGALPNAGTDYELYAIAAVVIGGGSLFGGVGTVWGAMLGALLLSVLNNGTDLLGVSTYFQTVLLGVVVVVAVYIDNFRRRPGTYAVPEDDVDATATDPARLTSDPMTRRQGS